MTVVNPKSISGITSITTASGGDDLLTIHNNNGAERFRVDGSGNTRITSGIVTTLSVGAVSSVGDIASVGAISGDISIDDKIIHNGDTNTALRFPSADTITAETGGSERLRITSAGLVGINSTIARSKLHVANGGSNYNPGNPTGLGAGAVACLESSSDVALQFLSGTADNFIYFGDTSSATTGSIHYDHSSDALSFNVNGGTERFRINSVGKVGINSTAPDGMLAIEHTSSAPNLTMRNHPAAGVYTNNYGMELRHAFGSVQHGCLIHTQEADLGRRALDVSDSGGVFATFVNGRVGIKSDRPAVELNVTGQLRAQASGDSTSYVNIKNNQIYMDANGTGYLDIAHVGGDLQVRASTSSALDTTGPTFKSNGNLAFASGKGIDFSATGGPDTGATGTSELLDDYEEGSWSALIMDLSLIHI